MRCFRCGATWRPPQPRPGQARLYLPLWRQPDRSRPLLRRPGWTRPGRILLGRSLDLSRRRHRAQPRLHLASRCELLSLSELQRRRRHRHRCHRVRRGLPRHHGRQTLLPVPQPQGRPPGAPPVRHLRFRQHPQRRQLQCARPLLRPLQAPRLLARWLPPSLPELRLRRRLHPDLPGRLAFAHPIPFSHRIRRLRQNGWRAR
jgi:hypothetical protein